MPQIVTYVAVEKDWSTKENNSKLWWNHDTRTGATVVGKRGCLAMSNSAKIKPIALVVIELRLSEGISK